MKHGLIDRRLRDHRTLKILQVLSTRLVEWMLGYSSPEKQISCWNFAYVIERKKCGPLRVAKCGRAVGPILSQSYLGF